MCFWDRMGELRYNEDEGCLFYQRQTLKLMIPILRRDELFNFRVGSVYSCLRYVSKGVPLLTK